MNGFAPTLALRLGDSRRLQAHLWALHALASMGLACLPLPVVLRLLLVGGFAVAAAWAWRRRPAPLRFVEIRDDGQCLAVDARGAQVHGVLSAGSLALPGLVVLALREPSGKRRRLAVANDACAPADLRRLRVRVRVAA